MAVTCHRHGVLHARRVRVGFHLRPAWLHFFIGDNFVSEGGAAVFCNQLRSGEPPPTAPLSLRFCFSDLQVEFTAAPLPIALQPLLLEH